MDPMVDRRQKWPYLTPKPPFPENILVTPPNFNGWQPILSDWGPVCFSEANCKTYREQTTFWIYLKD